MTRHSIVTAFDLAAVGAPAIALLVLLVRLVSSQRARSEHAREPEREIRTAPRFALLRHPLLQLGLVCALLLVNQLLFNAYVVRVHGGDVAFVGRYLPAGWCATIPRNPVVQWVAAHAGSGHALAPSVLRAQAFLELPFTLFAYLAVARPLSPRVYRTLVRLPMVALASVAFTIPLCLAELLLPNPWTNDDLVIRAGACIATPLYAAWLARGDRTIAKPASGVIGLLAFLASGGAIAFIVLASYDTFLLYNLAHLDGYAGGLTIAFAVAVSASYVAPRVDRWIAQAWPRAFGSTSLEAIHAALASYTVLFFAPSLAIRYAGHRLPAQACGAILVLAGCLAGAHRLWRVAKKAPADAVRAVFATVCGLVAGGAAAAFAASSDASLGELALARGAIAFLVTAIVLSRTVELALVRARLAKAPSSV